MISVARINELSILLSNLYYLTMHWVFFRTDVTVSLRQNSTAFSDSEDEFERICRYQG